MKRFFQLVLIIAVINTALSLVNAQDKGGLSYIYEKLGISEKISYTADMSMESSMGNPPFQSTKIFFKNGNTRMEGKQNGMKFITIMLKEGIMFSFNSNTNSWIKMDMNSTLNEQNMPEYKQLGQEEVEGKQCRKYLMTYPDMESKGFIWVRSADGIIYKSEIIMPQGTNKVYYKNIKKKKLSDALFSPPENANIQDMSTLIADYKEQE